jgi:hypothetical protein
MVYVLLQLIFNFIRALRPLLPLPVLNWHLVVDAQLRSYRPNWSRSLVSFVSDGVEERHEFSLFGRGRGWSWNRLSY